MKKRLLTAWIIACMFICLVGQTPIVALADGDDTRVISVPEGLQEVLNYETPEVQTVEDENTIVDIPETQVAEGEDATVENPDTQMIQEDNTVAENPETQAEQTEEAAEEVPAVQNETTVNETPADQIIQEKTSVAEIENIPQITETILTASIVASDGNTYETNVTYTNESGIPMEGTVLKVTELVAEDEGYDEYLEESASKVGVDTEDILFSKVFDIKIVDENDENIEYEPTGNVDVSIRVVGMSLDEFANLNVLHFVEDKNDENFLVYDVNTTVSEETVEFSTDSFSVYVVIGHENGIVENPRVMFHFIAGDATGVPTNAPVYFEGQPYSFINKKGDQQTTQILSDGESLEMIADPTNVVDPNNPQSDKYFYGWHIVDAYGNGIEENKISYSWPATPKSIAFESAISITEKNVAIGTTVHWSINGISGSGKVDANGNVHVLLAPMYENYNFVNFMLRPRDESGAIQDKTIMTRKLIARGSSANVKVKVSDIVSTSTDPVHLIFTGWEYNAGTETSPNWVQVPTIDYTGAELADQYVTINLEDTSRLDLYPIFVEARWTNYFAGVSGSGATYVPSRFLESWGTATPVGTEEEDKKNIFTELDLSGRNGYILEGWYAFAVTDTQTGEILNLDTPMDVEVTYIDLNNKYNTKTVTVNTKAIKIANGDDKDGDDSDGDKEIVYSDTCYLVDNEDGTGSISTTGGEKLFGAGSSAHSIKLYDALNQLDLCANWEPVGSKLTIVYWTEDAQEKGFVNTGIAEDLYSANKAITYTTEELNELYKDKYNTTVNHYFSGSTITFDELKTLGVLDINVLSGVVPDNERKFFKLVDEGTAIGINSEDENVIQENSIVINGDGKTVFNVYYERLTFKLVFHIGRDGYVKQNGQQKEEYMNPTTYPQYADWDGNWIQFMFGDTKVTSSPPTGLGYTKGPTANSYSGIFSMTYNNGTPDNPDDDRTYTSQYVTNPQNVMGDYVPDSSIDLNDTNVYVITAKYGAYIGDRWPTPTSDNFTFIDPNGSSKTMYTWAAYYDSLYCYNAQHRPDNGDKQNNNPDINGIYEYMSEELCTNRAGDGIINSKCVHHIVAYFGEKNNVNSKYKHYHIMIEAFEGTNAPFHGDDFASYNRTSWSAQHNVDGSVISGLDFYQRDQVYDVISNVGAEYQVAWEFDGYEYIYSCFNDKEVYFFYEPKQYTLTFMYESGEVADTYYYTQSLANGLDNHSDPVKEGYTFEGWYTNEAGEGEEFDFNSTMPSHNIILYPKMSVKRYLVKIDPNGGVIDHRLNPSVSTYFTNDYGQQAGEYTLDSKEYIKLSDAELDSTDLNHYYTGTKYYYINTQRKGIPQEGDNGYPAIMRNAVYVTESELQDYYDNCYSKMFDPTHAYYANPSRYTNLTLLSFEEFKNNYTDGPYRHISGGEKYTFMGWYKVLSDGTVSSMPYNFNDPVTEPLELRALWRLDGGYYVQYNPYYFTDDGNGNIVEIAGELEQWVDPANPNIQRYADRSPTNILRAPTNATQGWVFRGWRVVRATGTDTYTDPVTNQTKLYTIWEPIQLDSNGDPIYYQPGDNFIIDSGFVTDSNNGIIHMQAYYETVADTYRRPNITNLILDANDAFGGYINTLHSNQLPELDGPNHQSINETTELYNGHPTQILIGDIQSNIAIHLYRYATTKTFNGVTGKKYFTNGDGYLLIGFDEESDPENPTTGNAYIPAYASDSIAAVTRNETNKILYAMWEPMVYATFVNTTAEDLVINLSGTGGTVSIVNKATGEFDRESATTQIIVPAKAGTVNGEVKVVLPGAVPGTDSFTATTTNTHIGYKLSVNGVYGTDPYGEGTEEVYFNGLATYTGVLQTDSKGIVVTYSEEEVPSIVFDVNEGTWNETEPSFEQSTSNSDIYTITEIGVETINRYKPADPTCAGKVFIGWTTNADIAAETDFSSESAVTFGSEPINPNPGEIVLDKIRSDYLWDFTEPAPYGKKLYAVWSDAVTVTFNIAYSSNPNANQLKNHNWRDTTTDVEGNYVFYRSSDNSPYITYTMAKGEIVNKPEDPTPHSDHNLDSNQPWGFIKWLENNSTTDAYRYQSKEASINQINKYPPEGYAFDFTKRITANIVLSTSWSKYLPQTFSFTIENNVIGGNPDDEFTYTIAVSNEKADKRGNFNVVEVAQRWEPVEVKLKNNQRYTVDIKVVSKDGNDLSNIMTITDSEGKVVKSDQLVKLSTLLTQYFTSAYSYNLIISQEDKNGYTTTVSTKNLEGTIDFDTNDLSRSFLFEVAEISKYATPPSGFNEEKNGYEPGANNSLTVVFTNESNFIPAPTNYTTNYKPFFMMFGFGAILVGLIVPPVLMFRRRREEEE